MAITEIKIDTIEPFAEQQTLALAGAARGSLALLVSNPRNDLDPWGTSQGCLLRCAHRRSSRRPDASRPCRPAGQAQFMLPGDLRRPKRPTPVPRSLICRISVFGPVCGTRSPRARDARLQSVTRADRGGSDVAEQHRDDSAGSSFRIHARPPGDSCTAARLWRNGVAPGVTPKIGCPPA